MSVLVGRVGHRLLQRQNLLLNRCSTKGLKISVLGAMGEIGTALALMLKQSPWFSEIALHDIMNPRGLAFELNHIDTKSVATSHEGPTGLCTALKDANIVLIVAGLPAEKQVESSMEDLFTINCTTVLELAKGVATHSPRAFVGVCTNPLNSTLPIACETFKRINKSVDPSRMFGVTTVNVIRADTLVAEILQVAPETVDVPIIGGHSPSTVVPVLSHTRPCSSLSTEEVVRITRAIQTAGDEVLRAKEGHGHATLSMAFAACRFAISLAKAIHGVDGVIESAFLMSNVVPGLGYFGSQVQLGPCGVQNNMGIPDLSSYECCLLESAIPILKKDVAEGENFIAHAIKKRAV